MDGKEKSLVEVVANGKYSSLGIASTSATQASRDRPYTHDSRLWEIRSYPPFKGPTAPPIVELSVVVEGEQGKRGPETTLLTLLSVRVDESESSKADISLTRQRKILFFALLR